MKEAFEAIVRALVAYVVRYHGAADKLRPDLRPDAVPPRNEHIEAQLARAAEEAGRALADSEIPSTDLDAKRGVRRLVELRDEANRLRWSLRQAYDAAANLLQREHGGALDVLGAGVPIDAASIRLEAEVVALLPVERLAACAETWADAAEAMG